MKSRRAFVLTVFLAFGSMRAEAQERGCAAPLLSDSRVIAALDSIRTATIGPAGYAARPAIGRPDQPGNFVMLLRIEDGRWIPPHLHNVSKRLCVLEGELLMGHGETITPTGHHGVVAGAQSDVPANTMHFEGGRGRTLVALSASGPFTTRMASAAPPSRTPAQTPSTPPPSYGSPQIIDVTSAATGAVHRLFILKPNAPAPADGYPVAYLLDASWYFEMTAEIAGLLTRSGDIPPAIIVGIGYDDPLAARRLRVRDFTTPVPDSLVPPNFRAWRAEPGGAERFSRFLLEEVRPMIRAQGGASSSCQMLIGHSLSGLFAADVLYREPGAFASYAIGDASTWWDGSAILRREPAFRASLDQTVTPVRVLLAHSTEPRVGAGIAEFADQLSRVEHNKLKVKTSVDDGTTHNSMIPGFIAAALSFGLRCAP